MLDCKLYANKLLINLSGELDHATAPPIRGKLDEIIKTTRFSEAVFDLKDLKFMDSTGVGLIMGRYKLIRNQGKVLFIKNPSPAIDKVLTVSGIYTIIPKL
jgi:stage II sporulation protein AA (anti-sigma F factor antagonist)